MGLTKLIAIHPDGDTNVCPNFMAIHPIVVEIFQQISAVLGSYSTGVQRKSQGIAEVIIIHFTGTKNVCTNVYTNPSNSCGDISVRTKLANRLTVRHYHP